MSISVVVGGKLAQTVATNGGWADFVEWAMSLKASPTLRDFVSKGWTSDTSEVAKELRAALPAATEDQRSIADSLLSWLDNGDVLVVSDGLSYAE